MRLNNLQIAMICLTIITVVVIIFNPTLYFIPLTLWGTLAALKFLEAIGNDN